MTEKIILAVSAYLLGSIPFGYLITRFIKKEDIRAHGSGNIGATNVSRRMGFVWGIITLLLDAGKGAAAVLIVRHITHQPLIVAVALFAVVLGHCYPLFLGFKGGKGVATGAGAFAALSPLALLSALGIFVITVVFHHTISLGSCLATATIPLFFVLFTHPQPLPTLFVVLASCLIIYRHRENIKRILDGTENRFPPGRSS